MVSQMTAILAANNINIVNMLNKSLGDYACTLIDINAQVSPELLARLISIKGVLSVRAIGYLTNLNLDNQGYKSRKSWQV
jgi:D-3-phosphoglycerate dehydrogenase